MSDHFGFRPGLRPSPPSGYPLYSLITIVRNAAPTVERTLESVARQSYPALEYIVVDAGSTDGTVEILKNYEHLITCWCSEPDRGHADGQNKAVTRATGQYIGFVYADDWLDDDFITNTVKALSGGAGDFVFGDMNCHVDGSFVFVAKGDGDYRSKISYRDPAMNYPSLSACAYVFEKAGLFNTEYKVAPDYEWLFRVHHHGFRGSYDPDIRYNLSAGGHSAQHRNRGIVEVARAASLYGGNPIKIWGYAGLKIAFFAIDDRLRRLLPPSSYSRIRALRKAITG